jgi:predicted nucleic acid-binding Zn ribbon protein
MRSYKYEFEKQKVKKGRNQEVSTSEQAINDLISHYQLEAQFAVLDLKDAWREILGDSVARRTQQLNVKGNTIFVHLESAALKNELMMRKTFILQKLNLHTGNNPIEDLVFH